MRLVGFFYVGDYVRWGSLLATVTGTDEMKMVAVIRSGDRYYGPIPFHDLQRTDFSGKDLP